MIFCIGCGKRFKDSYIGNCSRCKRLHIGSSHAKGPLSKFRDRFSRAVLSECAQLAADRMKEIPPPIDSKLFKYRFVFYSRLLLEK